MDTKQATPTKPLTEFGWEPGEYGFSCEDCKQLSSGASRSWRCERCAALAWKTTLLEEVASPAKPESQENKLTGGFVNYYLVQVEHPQRVEQPPYQAECEDIIQALNLDFNEGCIFKAIWRSAAARMGNPKPDHKMLYDAEKIVHYATRNLNRVKRLK